MISKWKVAHFKSIREETEFELRPLTILAGSNSSGKSTLIQSILLMAQSVAPKVDTNHFVLNGTLTNLGKFDDLLSNDLASDQIMIECTYRPFKDPTRKLSWRPSFPYRAYSDPFFVNWVNQVREIACEVSFDACTSNTEGDLIQLHPKLKTCRLSCQLGDEKNSPQKFQISIRRLNETNIELDEETEDSSINDENQIRREYGVTLDEASLDEVKNFFLQSAKPFDCHFKHFLPDLLIVEYEVNEAIARAITLMFQQAVRAPRLVPPSVSEDDFIPKEVIELLHDLLKDVECFDELDWTYSKEEPPSHLKHESASIKELKDWICNLQGQNRFKIQREAQKHQNLQEDIFEKFDPSSKPRAKRSESKRLPRSLRFATSRLENFFSSSLKYLGPLRESPKQLYPIVHSADPYDVGLLGEHSAYILELHKDKPIHYIPSINFQSQLIERNTEKQPLQRAVNDWLQYLGVADTVISQVQSKWGRELKVKHSESDHAHDLTHVGVGVSQVLPILVMCLLAEPDSTLVLEQPELHLHPKVQTLLGDFFLSIALCNKQCIVETHSEYLIDRIRLRIASTPDEQEINSITKIYFVQKTDKGSTFQDVEINEFGAISNWPQGFFDQSQLEAQEILLAATKKRKEKRLKNRAESGHSND